MIRIVCSTLLCFFLCGSGFIQAEIQIENHTDGSTVRYPVILLRGSVSESASDLWVGVDQTRSPLTRHQNRFKSLVRLAPGQNVVRISTKQPAETQELTITYTPQTNPYYVRVVWMTDSSGDTKFATEKPDDPQQYEDRLRTAANLMQTATAERMHDLGLPRKTFRLERDADGRVVVHTLKGDHTTEHYHSLNERVWYRDVYRWINSQHPDRYAKNIVLAAYTRKNPETGKMMAHTALGGGNLGLFGSASVFSWPRSLEEAFDVFHDSRKFDASRVHDDSNSRSTVWGLASTTMGATLHEMGHTFGLPHCTKRYGIMTRGFDYFNRIFTFHDPTSRRNRQRKCFGVD